jgi:hypothetical protein
MPRPDTQVWQLELLAGALIVGGAFTQISGVARHSVARYTGV